jgi:hypothetical protein
MEKKDIRTKLGDLPSEDIKLSGASVSGVRHDADRVVRTGPELCVHRRRAKMFLTHRHPRFTLLLAALHIIVLLLLLPYSPFAPFRPSSPPPRPPSHPSIVYQGLSARVRRAERAYQKTLRARDALVAKVGPTPRDVALCV